MKIVCRLIQVYNKFKKFEKYFYFLFLKLHFKFFEKKKYHIGFNTFAR